MSKATRDKGASNPFEDWANSENEVVQQAISPNKNKSSTSNPFENWANPPQEKKNDVGTPSPQPTPLPSNPQLNSQGDNTDQQPAQTSQPTQIPQPNFNIIDRAGNSLLQNDNDPAGTVINQLQSKRQNVIDRNNSTDASIVGNKPKFEIQNGKLVNSDHSEVSDLTNQINFIKQNTFSNPQQAQTYLQQKLIGKTAFKKNDIFQTPETITPSSNLNDYDISSVKANVDKTNETENLAFNKFQTEQNLNNSLSNSRSINEAAVKYAAAQNPQIQKQFDLLQNNGEKFPDAYEGQLVDNFLNNPDLIQKAKTNADLATQYGIAKATLLTTYPAYGKKVVGNIIGQAREDRGLNNGLVNIPTQSTTDNLVSYLVKEGKLTPDQKGIYDSQIRPTLGVLNSLGRGVGRLIPGVQATVDENSIPTSGFLENFENSYVNTLRGEAKSVVDLSPTLWGNNAQRLVNSLQNDYSAVNVDPKGVWHQLTQAGGNLTGFIAPMIMGGEVTKAAGLGAKTGEFTNMVLMFEGNNRDNAIKQFPDDPTKQFLYTTLATGGDAMLGRMLPVKDAKDGIGNVFKSDIKNIINDLTDGKITETAARNTLLQNASDFVTKNGTKILKGNTTTGATMAGFNLFHNALDAAFGGRDVSVADAASDAIQTFKSGFLGGTFISALAANNVENPKINGRVLREMASDPQHFTDVINNEAKLTPNLEGSKTEKISNLNDAALINKDLDQTNLTDAQKEKYLIQGLSQKIWEKKAANTSDDIIAQDYLQKAKENFTNKEKIYQGLDKAPEYENFISQKSTNNEKNNEKGNTQSSQENVNGENGGQQNGQDVGQENDGKKEVAIQPDQIQGAVASDNAAPLNSESAISNELKAQDLYNFDNPVAEKNINGSNYRITKGSDGKFSVYKEKEVIGKFDNVKDAKQSLQDTPVSEVGNKGDLNEHVPLKGKPKDVSVGDKITFGKETGSENLGTIKKVLDNGNYVVDSNNKELVVSPDENKILYYPKPKEKVSGNTTPTEVSNPALKDVQSTTNALDKIEQSSPDKIEELNKLKTLDNSDIEKTVIPKNIEDKNGWHQTLVQKALRDLGIHFSRNEASTGTNYYGIELNNGESFNLRVADHEKGKNGRFAERKTDGNVEISEDTTPKELLEMLSSELPDNVLRDKHSIAEVYHSDKAAGRETELTKSVESLLNKNGNTGTTKGTDNIIPKEEIKPQKQDNKGEVQQSTESVGDVATKGADAVLNKPLPEKIKNKFEAFKNIKDENTTSKEQTTEENVKQSGDKNSAGTNEQKPTKTFKKRAKPTIKNPVYLKALANESEDPNSQVLKYFIGGGRVNRELLKQVMSNRTEELNTKFSLQGTTDENGRPTPKTVDELSHILWNNSSDAIKEKYDSEAFREAIENVVKDHNSRSSMAEELAGQVAPEEKEMHDWYDKTYGGYENEIPEENFNKAIDIAENLPDEQLQKIADTPTETELKVAQSNFDKATKQLKNAEKEFANKQGKQGDLLNPENNISQPDMFANSGQEVRNTLDPLRQKVREASAELEKVQRALGRPHDHLPDLFQVAEPQSEKISQMKGIVKDLQDEGYNKLSDIQNIAAKELGDNSPELKQLVEDAYHEAGKENEPYKKATELQTGLAQRVKSFVGKIFGKDKSSSPVVLKDSNAMMKKVYELQGDGKKVQFSINGENVTGKTVGADVVNGFYSPIEKRIGEFKQDNASATKWKEIVGSKDEAKWTGVNDWLSSLKPNEQVSKEQILQHMKDNRVQIVEVVKGEPSESDKQLVANSALYNENATKFSDYQLPGEKENYKEVLITMPNKQPEGNKIVSNDDGSFSVVTKEGKLYNGGFVTREAAERSLINGSSQRVKFKSSHFDEPNILAHVRMSTRTDSEGNKVLFVEEFQRDVEKEKTLNGKEAGLPFSKTTDYTKLAFKYALRHAVEEGADRIAWTTGDQQNSRYDLSKVVDNITYSKNEDGTFAIKSSDGKNIIHQNEGATIKEIEDTYGKDIAQKIADNVGDKPIEDKRYRKEDGTNPYYNKDLRTLSGDNLKVGGKGMKGFYGEPSEGKVGIVGNVAKALVKELTGKEGKIVDTKINTDKSVTGKDADLINGDYTISKNKLGDFEINTKSGKRYAGFATESEAKDWVKTEFSTQHSIEITPELKAAVEKGQPLFQKNDKGQILGFTDPSTGKIYLNGEHLNPNTPVHEAGHIWTEWAKDKAPAIYKRGIELISGSRYLRSIEKNDFYKQEALKAGKEGSRAYNEYMQHEALAKAIGDKGAQFITEARKKSFTEWAKNLWNKIAEAAGFKGIKADELQNMTLDEFSKRAATDILKGEPQDIENQKSKTGNEPPINNGEKVDSGESDNEFRISKRGLKADYNFSEEFDSRGGGEVAAGVLQNLKKESDNTGVPLNQQIANEVSNMKSQGEALEPTEHNIITAGAHLLNLNKQFNEALDKGEDVGDIGKKINDTNSVLRRLGNKAGRNLGLFNLVFKDVSDSEISVIRKKLSGALGVKDIPESTEDLKNSDLTDKDKKKVEPYVKRIEELKKEQAEYEAKSANNISSMNDEEVQKAIKEAHAAGKKEGLSQGKDKPAREKKSQQIKDLASTLRTSDEMDKFLKGASGDIQKSSIVDFGSYKEALANILDGVAEVVKAGENISDYIKKAAEKVKGVDKDKLINDIHTIISRATLPKKEDVIADINKIAENEKATNITKSMVDKGLIKNVVDDIIHSDVPYDKVIETATDELKKHLPNVTKEDVADAYVRRNEFKKEQKNKIDNTIKTKQQDVKRLSVKEARLQALEAAEEFHSADTREQQTKIRSDYEKNLDAKITDLNKQKADANKEAKEPKSHGDRLNYDKIKKSQDAEAAKLAKKLSDIKDEIDYVNKNKEVYERAIKNPKEANEMLKAAREERDKTYSDNGLRVQKNDRQPIKVEREYQKELAKIKENDNLTDAEKKDKIDQLKQQRDLDLQGTKQGVLSHLSDDLNGLKNDNIAKANDATKEDAKQINSLNKKIDDILNGIKPTGENLADVSNKAYEKINDLLKDKNLLPEQKEQLEAIRKDFENNNQLTSDQLASKILKKQWQRDIVNSESKIKSGNFTELPVTPYDFRRENELSILNRKRETTGKKLNNLYLQAKEKEKTTADKIMDFSTKLLVSGVTTVAKVGEAALFKPVMDSIVEASTGRLLGKLTDTPKTTLREIKKGYKTLAAFKNSDSADRYIQKLQTTKELALGKLQTALENGNKEEIDAAQKRFKKADLEYGISTLYKSIEANSLKTFWAYLAHGANDLDVEMGKGVKKDINDYKTKLEKAGYVLDGWIRTHAALKTSISARNEIMRSYASTLKYFQDKGMPLNEENLSLAHVIAENDFEYGRLSNQTAFSKTISGFKNSPKLGVRLVTRTLFPVSTIAVNIAKRGIDYSTGGVEGWVKLANAVKEGNRINETQGKTYDSWVEKMKDGIQQIPLKERKYINGVISRGLFGAALSAVTLWGLSNGKIKYGGTWDDKRKRKVIGSDGKVLEPGDWEFFGQKFPKLLDAFINHVPEMLPIALASDFYQISALDENGGKLTDYIKTGTGEIQDRMPFMTLAGLVNNPAETLQDRFTRVPIAQNIESAFDDKKREHKTIGQKLAYNTGMDFLNPTKFGHGDESNDPIFKHYLDKGLELPNTALTSETNPKTGKKISTETKEVQQKYTDAHEKNLKQILTTVQKYNYVFISNLGKVHLSGAVGLKPKKFTDLTNDELSQVLHLAQGKATRETKREIFLYPQKK